MVGFGQFGSVHGRVGSCSWSVWVSLGQFGSVHGRFGSAWVGSWSGWVGSWSVWISLGQFVSVHGFMVSLGRFMVMVNLGLVRFMGSVWVRFRLSRFMVGLGQFGSVHGRVGSVHGKFGFSLGSV